MPVRGTFVHGPRQATRPADVVSADIRGGSLPSWRDNARLQHVFISAVPRDNRFADQVFRDQLAAIIPSLRSFARGLCGSCDMADDMAQEAMKRGWAERASYLPGTSFEIWMFRILRNHFYTAIRRNGRTQIWDLVLAARGPAEAPLRRDANLVFDVAGALQKLPPEQREVLMLVEAHGMSDAEAARIIGCAIATVTNRLARGRQALALLIDGPAG